MSSGTAALPLRKPGLDELYLPRYIGYAFGTLLELNHFVGSNSSSITPAQLRTEVLGLCLAAFSAVVPYLGKFLRKNESRQIKGANEIGGDFKISSESDVVLRHLGRDYKDEGIGNFEPANPSRFGQTTDTCMAKDV
ncbi:UNVERIFIED_CONTAM: Protein COFACTOR ASSEMBLY OF COMPLEX C SUBUNIT B CCB2, chloroplastic [Sesamum indicum]